VGREAEFAADTFEEFGRKSHEHVTEQMQKGDEAHLSAANSMRSATPEQQNAMMAKFKQKFDEQRRQRPTGTDDGGFGF
jgi:hypothetical protein